MQKRVWYVICIILFLLYRKNRRFLPIQQKYILQKIAMQFSVDEQLNGACKI